MYSSTSKPQLYSGFYEIPGSRSPQKRSLGKKPKCPSGEKFLLSCSVLSHISPPSASRACCDMCGKCYSSLPNMVSGSQARA
ncbi:Piso0_004976 [Millerozyma farinosa CBS 7064]|uniref:Piso0_004976 protein n=1 Tax=Pichia sorbitophila (strain ATCC MYA-4447 / BCRC 22081 / CBS 7064 / NBRC 10061 / NRRL Y-12695) TaxID=559304 RepID=G8Y0Y0_PICSO|nr:Piso0_004976 [Millerozyma farinosa CBS 7064]